MNNKKIDDIYKLLERQNLKLIEKHLYGMNEIERLGAYFSSKEMRKTLIKQG